MQRDQNHKPGFYWVRFEGDVQVMELQRTGLWRAAGSDQWYADSDICELLSERLRPPQSANAVERLSQEISKESANTKAGER